MAVQQKIPQQTMTPTQMEKVEVQEQNLHKLKTEFGLFRTLVGTRFDEISKKLDPQFTKTQITTVMFMALTYMVSVMLYITDMKSDTRNNTTEVEHLKESKRIQEVQFQSIMNVLSTIKTDVEVLKSKE